MYLFLCDEIVVSGLDCSCGPLSGQYRSLAVVVRQVCDYSVLVVLALEQVVPPVELDLDSGLLTNDEVFINL